ncbi:MULTISPECIES: WYL domain-containing protein [unclassified Dietzia]|uniref:helix-turn-helix transcriptional regulator n=1 Tax=unclassified Dietzia TaxID=2617939 RepID=UPI0015F8F232|nr:MULTISPECIES: WYL domain-containing protein [unclassified Dietzia]MBB1042361.1 WYL domain-containing protein [Dietzia sp. Cai40]MBB1044768.1 WYL domain-containing protein [Dietzia sp. DQ11-44]MBB1054859.1 WYL domain-containing protein [Dietzia sp. B44]
MTPRAVPLATLLSVVPYFHTRGAVPVADAARDLGMSDKQLRDALWQLWSCGLPGYGPGDLIDLAFSSEDLDDAELVEVTFTAGIDRPVRLTAAEAVTLETGLAIFLDHPEVVDQTALRDLLQTLRTAAGVESGAGGRGVDAPRPETTTPDADVVRTAVHDGHALRFVYHSASSDTSTTRVVDPARLSVSDGHSYVHGVDRGTGQWRTFRTDRMSGVEEVGPRRALGPEPQDDGEAGVLMERAVVPSAAAWFLDEFGFHDVVRRPDGDLDVSIAYHDRAWLVRFLLGHADVVTPSDPALAAEIAARATAGLALYSAGDDSISST